MKLRFHWAGWVLLPAALAASAFLAGEPALAGTAVYRCVVDGVTAFSDRPCGKDAQAVTLETAWVSTFTPARAHGRSRATQAARQRPRSVHRVARSVPDRCASIAASLRNIASRQRAGYNAKEGIRLDERNRELKQRARELKCK